MEAIVYRRHIVVFFEDGGPFGWIATAHKSHIVYTTGKSGMINQIWPEAAQVIILCAGAVDLRGTVSVHVKMFVSFTVMLQSRRLYSSHKFPRTWCFYEQPIATILG